MQLTRYSGFGPLGWSAALITVAIASPIIVIAASIFVTGSVDILGHLANTVLGTYVANSLMLAIGVGVMTLLIGVPAAWFTSVCEFPGRKLFVWAMLLPLAFPAYIIAYAYTGILDYAGPVFSFIREVTDESLSEHLYFSVRSVPGAITMFSLVLYPYVYLLARTAFLEQSVSFLEASRTLGYSIPQGFARLAIPLARPAIVTGVSLALMETLADFGTVEYFGIGTFTTGIFRAFYSFGDVTAAAQLSTMLLGFVALLIFVERYSRRRARYHSTSGNTVHQSTIQLRGKHAFFAWIMCLIPVFLGFILPALILMKWVIFDAELNVATFGKLIWNSFFLAILAALIAVTLSIVLGYARRTSKVRLVQGFVGISGLGYAIPGAIIAVGIIVPLAWLDHRLIDFARSIFGVNIGLILSGSIFALLFAYTVRFLAISLGSVQSGLEKIRPNMDYAARVLGYRTFEVVGKVHLPLLRRSLLTAVLIVFVDVLKELPATLILRPFDFNTLAVRAYELASDERLIDAALPSLVIIATGIIPVILISKSISRDRISEH